MFSPTDEGRPETPLSSVQLQATELDPLPVAPHVDPPKRDVSHVASAVSLHSNTRTQDASHSGSTSSTRDAVVTDTPRSSTSETEANSESESESRSGSETESETDFVSIRTSVSHAPPPIDSSAGTYPSKTDDQHKSAKEPQETREDSTLENSLKTHAPDVIVPTEGSPRAIHKSPSATSLGQTVPKRKFEITTTTPLDDIINYFERVAKLDSYTSRLNHSQLPGIKRRGGAADVYRVATTDGSHVAVKCIYVHASVGDSKALKRSARELEVWSRLEHKNILRLLGLAKYQGCVAMVSDWMGLGSVVKFVNDRPSENRYSLSQQVVGAVVYLHAQEIVHGDIKGDNVLISDSGIPMLTDFGLTITADSNLLLSASNAGGGTLRWMAPELFVPAACRSKEADVYALGMTILEILTGDKPFAEIDFSPLILNAVVYQRQIPQRPECLMPPSQLKDAFWKAMTNCWTYEPTRRAKVTEIEELMANPPEYEEINTQAPMRPASPTIQQSDVTIQPPAPKPDAVTPDERRRRLEVVKAVLELAKSPPSNIRRISIFRRRSSSNDLGAPADLVRLEKRVKQGADAATAMAEHVVGWANALIAGAVQLLAWSRAFARVADLDVLLGGDPQGGSESVRAFTTVAASLEDLSRELAAVIKEELVPQLQRLAKTAREPLLLLAHMHTLAPAHHKLVNTPYSKSRPAALQEASQAYLALAAQLREELPRYVDMFERAFGIIVLRLSGWQARYFQEAERRWEDFWDALNVEEGLPGAGESAAVKTVRIWWSRWEATARQTAGMSIVNYWKPEYTRQLVMPTPDPAS